MSKLVLSLTCHNIITINAIISSLIHDENKNSEQKK